MTPKEAEVFARLAAGLTAALNALAVLDAKMTRISAQLEVLLLR